MHVLSCSEQDYSDPVVVVHTYRCIGIFEFNMKKLLIFQFFSVPQQGVLDVSTEFGKMRVEPNEICVIQVRIGIV
jgi:homogentisate 1,2-dioxygenase